MRTDFKVYKRKIHVYQDAGFTHHEKTGSRWVYAWSTNAYKTCRDAIAAAKTRYPGKNFTANFAKD